MPVMADDEAGTKALILNTETKMHRHYSLDEMLEMDWASMSGSEKDEVIIYSDSEDLVLLIAASDAMRSHILDAPYMSQTTTVYEYGVDEHGSETSKPVMMSYREYLTSYLADNRLRANWNSSGSSQIIYQKLTNGYFGGAPGGGVSYTVKFDFTSSGGTYNSMSKVVLRSVTGNQGAGFAPVAGTYTLTKNGPGNLVVAQIPISLSGLTGFVYASNSGTPFNSANTAEMSPGTGITGGVAGYTIYWHFNLWQNSSLGKEGTATPTYRFTLAPAANGILYDPNGGVTTPAPQTFGFFDGAIVAGAISKSPIVYTVTLDPAGGSATDTTLTSTRTFAFQHWQRSDGALYSAGQLMTGFGGHGATTGLTAQWSDSGQPAVTLPQAARTGYTFSGWTGAGVNQAAGSAFVPQGNETLTAEWTPISYTISYDTDGGSKLPDEEAEYDQTVSLPECEKEGYILKGWSGADLAGALGEVSNLADTDGQTVTLKAVWEPVKYTVSFDACGGTDVEDVVCVYDTPFTLPVSSRDDYTFRGWQDAEGNIISVAANLSSTADDKVTLTALWTASTVTVNFDTDGGSTINSIKYTIGDSSGLPETKKTGYTFKGWYDAAGRQYTSAQDIASETGTLTLKALWEKDPEIAVGPSAPEGITDEQMQKILKALESGSVATISLNGVEYSLHKNYDGTITIKIADSGNAERIVIPGEITIAGKTFPVTEIEKDCFKNNTVLKEVVMGSRIVRIGDSAFEGCSSLSKISLGESLMTIGNKAFMGCRSLKSIQFPASLQSIGNSAFEGCSSLGRITLNKGLMTVGNRAFFGCSGAVSLFISKSVLKIGKEAFMECTGLKTVTCEAGSQLISMGNSIFAKDVSLTRVSLSDKLTLLPAKCFFGCKKLKKIGGLKALTRIGKQAFYECEAMKKISLPSRLQKIEAEAFNKCRSLKKVSIKSGVLTQVGKNAFKQCAKGIRFTVPHAKTSAYAKLMKGKY